MVYFSLAEHYDHLSVFHLALWRHLHKVNESLILEVPFHFGYINHVAFRQSLELLVIDVSTVHGGDFFLGEL